MSGSQLVFSKGKLQGSFLLLFPTASDHMKVTLGRFSKDPERPGGESPGGGGEGEGTKERPLRSGKSWTSVSGHLISMVLQHGCL